MLVEHLNIEAKRNYTSVHEIATYKDIHEWKYIQVQFTYVYMYICTCYIRMWRMQRLTAGNGNSPLKGRQVPLTLLHSARFSYSEGSNPNPGCILIWQGTTFPESI